tara:strand:- start:9199 stop:9927 length:729 start_codon:yes stop_codon:yes gene_type:complete
MPNHCSNHLTVSGSEKEMKSFYDSLKSIPEKDQSDDDKIDRVFDFNDFIPMPESLHITSGSNVTRALEALKGEANIGPGSDYPHITEEHLEEAKTYLSNVEKYGHGDWYNWANANWGTKWNAYDGYAVEVEGDCFVVFFCTAWSPPMPIIKEMAKLFPKLTIEMEYQEEGMGFAGVMGSDPGSSCGFYDNEGELKYLSSCCNVDVNDDKHEEWCEDNDKESWETCPECKEDCESICEVSYNN